MLRTIFCSRCLLQTILNSVKQQLNVHYRLIHSENLAKLQTNEDELLSAIAHRELFEEQFSDQRRSRKSSTLRPGRSSTPPSTTTSNLKLLNRPTSNINKKQTIRTKQHQLPDVIVTEKIDLAHPKPKNKRAISVSSTSALTSPLAEIPSEMNKQHNIEEQNRLKSISQRLNITAPPPSSSFRLTQPETLSSDEKRKDDILEDEFRTEDEKILVELLGTLDLKKVRQMHKYTDEELKIMRKHQTFNEILLAYVDVSIYNGKLRKVRQFFDKLCLDQERRKTMKRLSWKYPSNVNIYNTIMFAHAENGTLRAVQTLFEKMRSSHIKPTLESYAAVLTCLGNLDMFDPTIAKRIIFDIEKNGFRVSDIFHLNCLNNEQIRRILKVLKILRPDFKVPPIPDEVHTKLLQNVYEQPSPITDKSNIQGDLWWKNINFKEKLAKQLQWEQEQKVVFKSISITKQVNDHYVDKQKQLYMEMEQQLIVGFLTELEILKRETEPDKLSIIPFLEIFDAKEYIQIVMKEVNGLFYGSDYYSLPYNVLCSNLGKRIHQRYLTDVRKKNGFLDNLQSIYQEYIEHCVSNQRFIKNERQKWNEIVTNHFTFMDRSYRPWSYVQICQIGDFFYRVMLKYMKLTVPLSSQKRNTINKREANSILHVVHRTPGKYTEKQIKVHPTVLRFFAHLPEQQLEFDCTELPCLVPPLPWINCHTGGYLLNQTDFLRLPLSANQQDQYLKSISVQQIGGVLDSINALNSCPWKINQRILDTIISIFEKGGDKTFSVPLSLKNPSIPDMVHIDKGLSNDEKRRRERERFKLVKQRAEIFSLWSNELYRLSIANQFRNEIFWFPHNLDFRGRVYPVPPHFNHLGSDIARGLILFAEGKPLGANGLRRLKIHLINLTDLKKRQSINEREQYANEIMDDILDSADKPLTGRLWWSKSEEPWQTLACCMEIANAIRSPDSTKYLSYFPVHQDGTCNVLQHYAAMGLDDVGAASVNLKPSDLPKDVYSDVVEMVELERQKDEELNIEMAKILKGFIKRKVIKQTIMTTNYGVTMYGARQQIGRQLRDIEDFPKIHVSEASTYLAKKTFLCLRELFRETKKIQDWFKDCASLISRVRGTAVEWNTPLGLPVVQPYYKEIKIKESGHELMDYFNMNSRPNNIKQKNAFPPNYVHSLDSTHMMMTALNCAKNGITFVSVHDSFWTHPCDVDILSKICREQFVALHKEPLLENLSQDFTNKFGFKSSEFSKADETQTKTMKLINDTIHRVPERGIFKLESVLDSTYFFS
ncbi:unnamed protein product [Didymodactylos carnosus]|uniref:DNA-directed RNA polymerase n=1 Tax=Didymodactylos carnosus TaxID=1234261 RepID=A0A813S5W6_9BILA|nr:unnamed protein product [Didymodactylos carnosus]CAF0871478.1 unnamed protein product [Didymodactylos carnosus]CAF3574155.1 unnamed protein product [Didymodactylos carnosus]CAF3656306.1 unnamed protein product [Didymodactylos carnosus]